MKRFTLVALLALLPAWLQAGTYTFSNTSSSIKSLAHGSAVTWGLQDTSSNSSYSNLLGDVKTPGNVVTGATLTIYNIYDWTTEPKDVLYVNLLNNVSTGVHAFTYNSNASTYDTSFGTDPFSTSSSNYSTVQNHLTFDAAAADSLLVSPGTPAGSWSDPHGGHATNFNLVLNFSQANLDLLNQYLSGDPSRNSPNVGLGFGPDCHYYDSGVCLTITTGQTPHNVPDTGSTLLLLGTALAAVAGFRRRRARESTQA